RFDVVVFEREGQQPGIKRIIGLPGETVQIKNGSVYINGELLKAENGLAEATIAGVAEYPVELGDDEYFLLGDNRESSEDSRFSGIGNIKRENLIGRVWLRFQPFSRLGFVR
ncbi:MAG TPA: signal peptidase I, partial [Lachnoclostridium sp.]|nr:signal peptidase I [Lachnoclostridium sp.]